jgi:hypothetical protein
MNMSDGTPPLACPRGVASLTPALFTPQSVLPGFAVRHLLSINLQLTTALPPSFHHHRKPAFILPAQTSGCVTVPDTRGQDMFGRAWTDGWTVWTFP